MKRLLRLSIFFMLCSLLLASCADDDYIEEPYSVMQDSPNYKAKVAIFGGSFSVNTESNIVKRYWKNSLRLDITNYGEGSAGYSRKAKKCVQDQIDRATSAAKPMYDIYILWCSTNDATARAEIGDKDAFTEADGYAPEALQTQNGGLNYCYAKIKKKNPKAKILLLTSIGVYAWGEQFHADDGLLAKFVDAQIELAEARGMTCVNLFEKIKFTPETYKPYFLSDDVHLNESGYLLMKDDVLAALATM